MSELLREYIGTLVEREIKNHCRYERLVIRTLKDAGINDKIRSANCTDSIAPDADIKLGGETYFVEVKASELARMGSASMAFSPQTQMFYPAGLNKDFSGMMADVLNSSGDGRLLKSLNRLIRFLKHDAIAPRKVSEGFPLSGFLSSSWEKAKKLGLLREINRHVDGDISVIARHYAAKNTHYIQIGGWGLYTLSGNNPVGLPVPQLDGSVTLEIEAKKSGDMQGRLASKAAFRVHARLQPANTSPYTLDDPESISAMLEKVEQSPQSDVELAHGRQITRARIPKVAHVR